MSDRRNIWRIADLVILFLCSIPLVYKIGASPIRIWDEAIYANNAVEMVEYGKLLQLLNNGVPSYYNAKPPLGIWLQAASIKLFGISEFAIRLPSVLAAIGVVLLLFHFGKNVLQSRAVGWLAPSILVLSGGFVRDHVSRTGDLDALLVFCTTGLSLLALQTLVGKSLTTKQIGIMTAFAVAGFFIKSVAVFLVFPAVFLILLMTPDGREIFRKWQLFTCIAGGLTVIGGYLLFKAWQDPLVLEKFIHSDVSRAVHDIMPWHSQSATFYIDNLLHRDFFTPFVYLLPIPVYVFVTTHRNKVRNLIAGLFLFFLVFELTISISPNKLDWYDAPVYPVLALLVSVGLNYAGGQLLKWSPGLKFILIAAMVIFLSFLLYNRLHTLEKNTQAIYVLEHEGNCLREMQGEGKTPQKTAVLMKVATAAHYHQVNFYRKKLNLESGKNIELYPYLRQLRSGDRVLTCQNTKIDSLHMRFQTRLLARCENCQVLLLEAEKSAE